MSATLAPARSLPCTSVQRRDPGRDQVGDVAGPEELLAPDEDVLVVLVPAQPGAGAERLGDPRLGPQRRRARARTRRARRRRRPGWPARTPAPRSSSRCPRPGRTRRTRLPPDRAAIRRCSAGWCWVRAASSSAVAGPAASAWYRPSWWPITTFPAATVAPRSVTNRPRNSFSLSFVDGHDVPSLWVVACLCPGCAAGRCTGVATALQWGPIERGNG